MSHVFQVVSSRAIPVRSVSTLSQAPQGRRRIDSHELLQGERELIIQHGDQEYRLRHTQNDKLILTK